MAYGHNEVLASFDDLEQAKAYRGPRGDRRYVIRDRGRKIVWPPDLVDRD
jgi:hypothetical protein